MTLIYAAWPNSPLGNAGSEFTPGQPVNDGLDFPAARRLRWLSDPLLSVVDDPPDPTIGGTPQKFAGVKADKHY